jgi:hypothetical protein
MYLNLKNASAKAGLLAAAGLLIGFSSAQAADLGGNCCADLEERIAELEATTARKGNRKVKLEVSGHVNEALIFWDDGVESNQGVYTNDNSRTRFRFKGTGKISDDLEAGYLLEIGVRGANSKRFTQDRPNPADEAGLDVRHSAWFVKSKSLGTFWMGRTGPAAESITEINLAQTKDVAKFSDVEDSALGLNIRSSNGLSGYQFRRVIGDFGDQAGEVERGQIVKYITPEFAGFALTAAWGGDDYWDVGLNYKGEIGDDFKIAAGIAYGQENIGRGLRDTVAETQIGNCGTARDGDFSIIDCEQIGGSISVMHSSGIYVNFSAGWRQDNEIVNFFDGGAAAVDDDSTHWSLEAGIEQKWNSLGKTTLFGQYYEYDGGSTDQRNFADGVVNANVAGQELRMYGGGIVQGIDAAAMSLYVYYRHVEADLDLVDNAGAAVATPSLEDLDIVVMGGIIRF